MSESWAEMTEDEMIKCSVCKKDFKETGVQKKVKKEHAGKCYGCWMKWLEENDEDVKREIAEEKATWEKKSVLEKLVTLLDNINSCQDELHPSSLKGYQNCLKRMVFFAKKRFEFQEAYEKEKPNTDLEHLWKMLERVVEDASKDEENNSLDKCKETANFIEKLTENVAIYLVD